MKGEGGARNVNEGRDLWQRAAAKGSERAQAYLDMLDEFISKAFVV